MIITLLFFISFFKNNSYYDESSKTEFILRQEKKSHERTAGNKYVCNDEPSNEDDDDYDMLDTSQPVQSDEKNKKHIIEDENRSTIIQNNKFNMECKNPKVGNEKSTTGTENVSIGKNISSLEEVKESWLDEKNELVVNHDGNKVLGKEDDTLQNSYTTLLD